MTEEEIRKAAREFNKALDKQHVPVRDKKTIDTIRKAHGLEPRK